MDSTKRITHIAKDIHKYISYRYNFDKLYIYLCIYCKNIRSQSLYVYISKNNLLAESVKIFSTNGTHTHTITCLIEIFNLKEIYSLLDTCT